MGRLEIERRGSLAVLAPEGPHALAELRKAAEDAIAAGAATLLVDLAKAPHLRGDELEHLTGVAFVCESAKRGLALSAVSPDVRRALELLGLAGLFPYLYADRADALARLESGAIAPPGEPPMEIGF